MDNNDINLSGIDIFGESIKGQKGEKKKVLVTETVLRDAHQSLMATRMRTEDMLSVAAKMDEIGYYSFEMWGGATFDAAMRFLNEDPWERLRALRRVVKKLNFKCCCVAKI